MFDLRWIGGIDTGIWRDIAADGWKDVYLSAILIEWLIGLIDCEDYTHVTWCRYLLQSSSSCPPEQSSALSQRRIRSIHVVLLHWNSVLRHPSTPGDKSWSQMNRLVYSVNHRECSYNMGQKIAPTVRDYNHVSRCPNGRVFAFQQRGTKFDNGTSSNRRRLHLNM